MWSVPRRWRLFSTSLVIQRRELPRMLGSSSLIDAWTLVASTTSSRRPLRALPTISSDSPAEYTSALSTKLIPASSARWTMRIESSWSVLPQAPNIIVPRQSFETWTPVRPSGRYSIGAPSSQVGHLDRRTRPRPMGDPVSPREGGQDADHPQQHRDHEGA